MGTGIMSDGTLQRFDEWPGAPTYRAVWGLRLPGSHRVWSEYMVVLVGLDSSLNQPHSHEVFVTAIAPETPVDFSRNIFEQSGLSPLVPLNHAYQFKSSSNEAAKARVQVIVNSLMAYTLSPEPEARTVWDDLWRDGTRLSGH